MKHELPHFYIGDSYGGNQDWFLTRFMRVGGCGAETACDSCVYFAREFGLTKLYPGDPWALTREEYVNFAQHMRDYLWPRMTGIDRLSIYVEWFGKYLKDCGEDRLSMAEFSGEESYEAAEAFVRRQIDAGFPIPTLILEHKDPAFRDYFWHWFLINGYDDTDGFKVKAVTYSEYEWLPLEGLWNTGSRRRGGFVEYRLKE